jgi:hypothetical protein
MILDTCRYVIGLAMHFAYEAFHNGGFLAWYPRHFAYVALD